MIRKELKIPLFLLLVVLMTLCFFYLLPKELILSKNILSNLITEIIGIFITVIFIDSIVTYNEVLKQKKIQRVAFKQLKFPLNNQLLLFTDMFKAAVDVVPEKRYLTHAALFDDTIYFEKITFLDLEKDSGVIPSVNWRKRIREECLDFNKSIEKTLDRYLQHLDTETISLIENLINSEFIDFVSYDNYLTNKKTIQSDMIDFLQKYLKMLSSLLELYNVEFPNEKIELDKDFLRNTNITNMPLEGSGRIEENYS